MYSPCSSSQTQDVLNFPSPPSLPQHPQLAAAQSGAQGEEPWVPGLREVLGVCKDEQISLQHVFEQTVKGNKTDDVCRAMGMNGEDLRFLFIDKGFSLDTDQVRKLSGVAPFEARGMVRDYKARRAAPLDADGAERYCFAKVTGTQAWCTAPAKYWVLHKKHGKFFFCGTHKNHLGRIGAGYQQGREGADWGVI